MSYLLIFQLKFKKNIVIFRISTPEFVKTQKFVQNKKTFKFGTKNVLFEYFQAAILKETVVIFEINPLELVKLQTLVQK